MRSNLDISSPPALPRRQSPARASCRGSLVLALVAVAGCDASCGELASYLPFSVPFLNTDGGGSVGLPPDGGPLDGSVLLADAGLREVAEGEECSAASCAAGLDCVVISTVERRCLRPCTGGCATDQHCELLASGSYCLDVVGRGERCERRACTPGSALRCLPARVEGSAVLATTCQQPCSLGAAEPACSAPDTCLPSSVGLLELQGGSAVSCTLEQCQAFAGQDAGECPCQAPFACVQQGSSGVCARAGGVCGRGAPVVDPGLLPDPSQWPDGGTCDPGPAQRYCAPINLDAGTPVFCAQGTAEGLAGLCIALCQEPGGPSYPCPSGFSCSADQELLVSVTGLDGGCEAATDCLPDAGERCVGPLPAFGMGYRCAVPYGLCTPE